MLTEQRRGRRAQAAADDADDRLLDEAIARNNAPVPTLGDTLGTAYDNFHMPSGLSVRLEMATALEKTHSTELQECHPWSNRKLGT